MGGSTDDGPCATGGFFRLGKGSGIFHEDAGTDEDCFGAQVHDQRGVGRGGDSSG